MDTDCVIHFKDKVFIEEKKREFTEVTFKKFLDCRKEWLSLKSDYKGFVTDCDCCKRFVGQGSS